MELNHQELIHEQNVILKEVRDAQEKGVKISKEHYERLEKKHGEYETEIQKIRKELESANEKNKILESNMERLEKKAYRISAGVGENDKEVIIKTMMDYVSKGLDKGNALQTKLLRTDQAERGGVLIPELFADELIKQEIEISPIMANAKIVTRLAKSLSFMIRTNLPVSENLGEAEAVSCSEPQYKQVRIEAFRLATLICMTEEERQFTAVDGFIEEITSDVATEATQRLNDDFINGDGVNKSEGILTNATVKSVESLGTAGTLTFDDFMEIQKGENIKSAYQADGKFYLNSSTLFTIRQLKASNGTYLWGATSKSSDSELVGRPYVICPDMPNIAEGSTPVVFGNLSKAYRILKSIPVRMLIDEYTRKTEGVIEYLWSQWIGGKVVLPEAIVKLKVKSS